MQRHGRNVVETVQKPIIQHNINTSVTNAHEIYYEAPLGPPPSYPPSDINQLGYQSNVEQSENKQADAVRRPKPQPVRRPPPTPAPKPRPTPKPQQNPTSYPRPIRVIVHNLPAETAAPVYTQPPSTTTAPAPVHDAPGEKRRPFEATFNILHPMNIKAVLDINHPGSRIYS
ncbi:hypothetical protein Q1695_000115 [Nippostrongylus brasiliensis]|nr:hypothetical protein Q1695_000115 [Nippostrongylus brasiliensis]